MNKENIAKKAEAYALKKWGYKEGTASMDIIYMDTAVVNNSTEDFTAGYTEGHRDATAALQGEAPQKMGMGKLRNLLNALDGEEISMSKFLEEINNHFIPKPENK